MNKNKKILTNMILSGITIISLNVNAQTSYLGLNYPKPEIYGQKFDKTPNPPTLEQLLSNNVANEVNARKNEVNEIRKEQLIEIASSIGASAGLVARMKEKRIEIDNIGTHMDNVYDFSKLIISNGVLAPVLSEGLSNYAQESEDQVRIADKIYKIESPAKFVSVYPTWRDYLYFSFPLFDNPPSSALPKTDAEKIIWDEAVRTGWFSGIQQANNIVDTAFNRLNRDYQGMIKYKLLLAQGVITPTMIAGQNLGVTGGGKEMAINDQLFRITDHSNLNPNTNDWKVEYPVTNQINKKLK